MIGFPPVNSTTGSWSSVDVREAYSSVSFPLAIVSLIVNVIGVLITYSFKKTRAFPASVLGWNGLFNVYAAVYTIMKWAPNSATSNYLVKTQSDTSCSLAIFLDLSVYYADVACNTVIALTLYFSVFKRWGLEYREHPRYFWFFVCGIWAWFLIIPLVVAKGQHLTYSGLPFCIADSSYVYVYTAPAMLLVAIQIGLVCSSFRSAFNVIKAAASLHQKKDIRKAYLIFRFGATFLSQLLAILPYIVILISLAASTRRGGLNNNLYKFLIVGPPVAYILDGLVLIFTNKSFRHWLKARLSGEIGAHDSSSDETKKGSRKSTTKSDKTAAELESPHDEFESQTSTV